MADDQRDEPMDDSPGRAAHEERRTAPDSPLNWTESESESDGDFFDDELGGHTSSRIPRDTTRKENIPRDVRELLGEAQKEWAKGNHQEAIKICQEAVKIDGQVRQTYNLLASIYEDTGDEKSALVAKFLAATLNKGDYDDWMDIVNRAVEQNKLEDAALALQQVSNIKSDEWRIKMFRVELYFKLNQHSKALAVLNRIRQRHLQDMDALERAQVFKYISICLKALGRLQDALEMYGKLFNDNISGAAAEAIIEPDGLEEYASMLATQRLWTQTIDVVKSGMRFMGGRSGEAYWDDVVDDSEYDQARRSAIDAFAAQISDDPESYAMPEWLRIILLECRLKLWLETNIALHLDEAHRHAELLLDNPSEETTTDTYWRAADAFFAARQYDFARVIYDDISGSKARSQQEYTKSQVQIAKCCALLKSVDSAARLYEQILELDAENIEALIGLAEAYQELGKKAESKSLVQKAVILRAEELQTIDGLTAPPPLLIEGEQQPDENTDPALFASSESLPTSKQKARAILKARHEENQTQLAENAFIELDRFNEGLQNGNVVATAEWIRNASILIQIFKSNKKFFPSDRTKQFAPPRMDPNLTIDERLAMSRVGAADEDEDPEEVDFKFKGKNFDEWFELFMKAALTRARNQPDNVAEAYAIVRLARLSNIFHNNPQRQQIMNLVQLSCAYLAGDRHGVAEGVRQLYSLDQFNEEILLYYNTLLSSGQAAVDTFASANNQKYFLRNIKALDSTLDKQQIKGAARITKEGDATDSPVLRLLYAQIMLLGPSYTPALTYLFATLNSLPQNPMVLLMTAIVCYQRSLQRVTPNRHLQILQGMSFMQDYVAVRQKAEHAGHTQESNYNMGRFFHGLGLFALAIPYYERVFECKVDEDYDMSVEAAYNLHLIYAIDGNMRLARQVVEDYLTL